MKKINILLLVVALTTSFAKSQTTCSSAVIITPSGTCNYSNHTTIGTEYWLKFTATSPTVNVSLITVQFGTNAPHIHNLQLISGTCSTQVVVAEDELPFENSADKLSIDLNASGLTIGNTYYIRAERQATHGVCDKGTCTASGSTNPTTFQICIENINVIIPLDFGAELPTSSHAYITNRGQLVDNNGNPRPEIKLYSQSSNPAVYIADSYTSFVFLKSDNNISTPDTSHRVDMTLAGGNSNLKVFKTEETQSISNYYYPHAPRGITGNKSYSRSVCNNVYPNIDMQFYSNKDGVKFYFIVRPGGDADNIVLKFNGATSVNVTPNGGLKIITPLGILEFEPAHAYQINPGNQIVPMPWQAEFIQLSANTIKFDIRNYPHNMPLFIQVDRGHSQNILHISNPEWSTYFGGNGYDEGTGVTNDTDGNSYWTGFTSSNFFPALTGQFTYGGSFDAYIARFGTAIMPYPSAVADKKQWTTYYGGTGDDRGLAIATIGNGVSGNVFVTGYTESGGFPTYNNAGIYYQSTNAGGKDAFLIKLDNATGGVSIANRWATHFGGNGDEIGKTIKADAAGNILIGGRTSTNFYSADVCNVPTDNGFPKCNTSSSFNNSNAYGGGVSDGFIAKFNSSGQLQWSSFYGGTDEDEINSIAIDGLNNLYFTGKTASSSGFPITSLTGAFNQSVFGTGTYDAFISRFNNAGNHIWCSYFGGNGDDAGLTAKTDAANNFYFAGKTSSSTPACTTSCLCIVPNTGEFPLCNQTGSYFQGIGSLGVYGGGISDGFFAKFDNTGKFKWGTYYGASNEDFISGLDVDDNDNLFFTGRTFSPSSANLFFSHPSAWYYNHSSLNGPSAALVGTFDVSNIRRWSAYYDNQGSGDEISNSVSVYSTGSFEKHYYITGATSSTNFYTMAFLSPNYCCPNADLWNSYAGSTDAFLVRFSEMPMWMSVEDVTSSGGISALVYPNPTNSTAFVQLELKDRTNVFLSIYSITGQLVYEKSFKNIEGFYTETIDLQNLTNGVYLIQIKTENDIISKKIIKQN